MYDLPPGNYKIQYTKKTMYVWCPVCQLDVCWPSWCKCKPQRVMNSQGVNYLWKTRGNERSAVFVVNSSKKGEGNVDTSQHAPGAHGHAETP